MIDKGRCDKGFIWNPNSCKCECDKSCDVGEYLHYANCKCRKRDLIEKLVEECNEDINGNEMICNTTLNEKVCSSCTINVILFATALLIIITIGSVYIYFYWYLKRSNTSVNTSVNTETLIYSTYKWELSKK